MADDICDSVSVEIMNYLRVCHCDHPGGTHEVGGEECHDETAKKLDIVPEISGTCSICYERCNTVCNCGHICCEECIRRNLYVNSSAGTAIKCAICRNEMKNIRKFAVVNSAIILSDYKEVRGIARKIEDVPADRNNLVVGAVGAVSTTRVEETIDIIHDYRRQIHANQPEVIPVRSRRSRNHYFCNCIKKSIGFCGMSDCRDVIRTIGIIFCVILLFPIILLLFICVLIGAFCCNDWQPCRAAGCCCCDDEDA